MADIKELQKKIYISKYIIIRKSLIVVIKNFYFLYYFLELLFIYIYKYLKLKSDMNNSDAMLKNKRLL